MRKLIGLSVLPLASLAFAVDAPVEELGPPVQSAGQAARAVAQASQNQALVDLHFEVQALRDEVRELRGIVEEQANELRQLKQRQLDDYQDLDRRISASATGQQPTDSTSSFTTGGGTTDTGTPTGGVDSFGTAGSVDRTGAGTTAAAAPAEGEYEAYIANYNLIKARKIDEAVAGFNQFVAKFPNGQYTANAYYWLGEIYLLQNDLGKAETAFARVAEQFPAHSKVNDAKFKLGKVYHLQGRNDQARALLGEVADTNSGAASLAQAYLNDNF